MTANFSDKHAEKLNCASAQERANTSTTDSTALAAKARYGDRIEALTFLEKARNYIRKAHELAAR